LACLLAGPAAAQQQPAATPATVIDGPTSDLAGATSLGLSIARDGTGGAVYLKQAAGTPHVFVSRLAGGSFQPPVQVDSGLAGPSSQPVIAAGNGGLLLVGFINGGVLFSAEQPAGGGAFAAPVSLASGAANPAISMSNSGKAYLAFSAADGSGTDVRAAYFWQDKWAVESSPLNLSTGDDAGSGSGRPAVTTAGDGVGIVAWGESGGVFTRRVWGTSVSVVYERADGALPGCTELAADEPALGAGGDSSYVPVGFHEQLTCGGQTISRVLVNRLRGSAYDGLSQADGQPSSADGADDPRIAIGEYGDGLLTSQRASSHALMGAAIGDNGMPGGTSQLNTTAGISPPWGVPAMAGLFTRLVAWQQDPGASGPAEIRLRYAPGRDDLGSEVVLSSPLQGPADAGQGLAADGDSYGDAAVVWVQGPPGAPQIMAAQLYQAPGGFSVPGRRQYVRTSSPTLSWSAPKEPWGPLHFVLNLDGVDAVHTDATSAQVPSPLPDGPHRYLVTAANPAGQQSQTGVGHVFVDTTPPVASLALNRVRLIGRRVQARLAYQDLPQAGEPAGDASGVLSVSVRWGDGTVSQIRRGRHRIAHIYLRPRRYTVTLVVTDRSGNVTRSVVHIRIKKPKPKPKPGKAPPHHLPRQATGDRVR
jgi:hypothetical protein